MAEETPQNTVLPVTGVTTVTSVTKKTRSSREEGNKSNKGNESNREQHLLTSEKTFLTSKSDKDKLAIFYHDHPDGLSDAESSKKLDIPQDNVKIYRTRLKEWVQAVGSHTPQKYTLSPLGRAGVEKWYLEYRESYNRQEKQRIELQDTIRDMEMRHLDLPAQIQAWRDLLEQPEHKARLFKQVRQGHAWTTIDFSSVAAHMPELADALLDQPLDVLKAAQVAIEKMDLPKSGDVLEKVQVRVHDLPKSDQKSVKDIRSDHLSRLFQSNVEIITKSDIRPQAVTSRHECPSCGNIIPVLQLDERFKEPERCSCGRKGKFKLLSKELVDTCYLKVTLPLEETLGTAGQRPEFRLVLKRDLARSQLTDKLGPGTQARISYVPHEVPVYTKGGQGTHFDLLLEAVHIEALDQHKFSLKFTPEEETEFREEAHSEGFLDKLAESIYSLHYGDRAIKWALTLQLLSGSFTERRDQENLHILIVGDPGTGKSENLLKQSVEAAPIARLAVGTKATSYAGLIGTTTKDELTGRYYLEPGLIPRHNRGLVAMDELDKMNQEIQTGLNQSMASGICSIDKAHTNVTIVADVRILAAANPTGGRFDENTGVTSSDLSEINETLRDRFLIFVLRDRADQGRDQRVADILLGMHTKKPAYTMEWAQRYILYCRDRLKPVLRREEAEAIKKFYTALRGQDGGRISIGPRQLKMLAALTLLSAKAHLRDETAEKDLKLACEILEKMLSAFGWDMSTLDKVVPR